MHGVQASSEHNISVAVPAAAAAKAQEAISEAFFREIHIGDVEAVTYIAPVSIVAAGGG